MDDNKKATAAKTTDKPNQAPAPSAPAAQPAPAAAPAGSPHKTNGVAIAAIIFAILFPLLGLILGIIALAQIKKSNEGGKGLAVASIVISILIMLSGLIFFFTAFAAIQRAAKDAGVSGVNVGSNGSVSVKGNNGESLSVGGNVKIPDGFPSNVPIYKPSDVVAALKTNDGYNLTLATNDDAQKVSDYYKSQLPSNGWTNESTDLSVSSGTITSYTQGDKQLVITITSDQNGTSGKKTGVNITVANNASNSQ